MESKRGNDVQLAIDAIIRGLELGQVSFAYEAVAPTVLDRTRVRLSTRRVQPASALRLEIC